MLFAIGHEADVLDASFDPPLCDEVIFLWLTVEGIDSWMNDNHHKQQKLIHKIPLSPNLNLFCEIYFRDWQSPIFQGFFKSAPGAPPHVLAFSESSDVYPCA